MSKAVIAGLDPTKDHKLLQAYKQCFLNPLTGKRNAAFHVLKQKGGNAAVSSSGLCAVANAAKTHYQLALRQSTNGEYGTILDTEDSDYWEGTINGCEAYFNTKNGCSSIMWIDENIVYDLYGYMEIGELKTVAQNIKISPN